MSFTTFRIYLVLAVCTCLQTAYPAFAQEDEFTYPIFSISNDFPNGRSIASHLFYGNYREGENWHQPQGTEKKERVRRGKLGLETFEPVADEEALVFSSGNPVEVEAVHKDGLLVALKLGNWRIPITKLLDGLLVFRGQETQRDIMTVHLIKSEVNDDHFEVQIDHLMGGSLFKRRDSFGRSTFEIAPDSEGIYHLLNSNKNSVAAFANVSMINQPGPLGHWQKGVDLKIQPLVPNFEFSQELNRDPRVYDGPSARPLTAQGKKVLHPLPNASASSGRGG